MARRTSNQFASPVVIRCQSFSGSSHPDNQHRVQSCETLRNAEGATGEEEMVRPLRSIAPWEFFQLPAGGVWQGRQREWLRPRLPGRCLSLAASLNENLCTFRLE